MNSALDTTLQAPSRGRDAHEFVPVTVQLDDGKKLHITCHENFRQVACAIENLHRNPFHTLFNSTSWLSNWIGHAARNANETPCFIIARDDNDQTAFVWPMALHQNLGVRSLGWLGQNTFAVNVGSYRHDIALTMTCADLHRIFTALRKNGLPFDALRLLGQPEELNGVANPMLKIGRQLAPNGNHERALQADYDELYSNTFSSRERRNHARQRRRLADHGDVKVVYPTSPGQQQEILDAFFSFKASQLHVKGAPDPFKDECIRTFFRSALITQPGKSLAPRFCGLYLNGNIVATLIGVTTGTRFTTLFSAISSDKKVKASPGQQLLETLVRDLCQEGIRIFDFGPGASIQKERWDMAPRPLFHSFVAMTSIAWPATQMNIARTRITQAIKTNKRVYEFLSNLRARIGGK